MHCRSVAMAAVDFSISISYYLLYIKFVKYHQNITKYYDYQLVD